MNPLKTAAELTISIIELRQNIFKKSILELEDAIYLVEQELDILSDALMDADDKNRVRPFVDGARDTIVKSGHVNFRKIADEYLVELQSCLIALQEVLSKREVDMIFEFYEPGGHLALNA